MANKRINFGNREFADIREELYNYIKTYYPDILADFSDSSIGNLLLELNAATANILSHHTDRMFQETQLEHAQQRKSILALAKTLGFNIPNKRASVTVVDFTVTVPVKGDTFDVDYLPIIKAGTQALGGGKIFETLDDIDFSTIYSNLGVPNRIILPNIDSNDIIQSYTIVKREAVFNGESKILKKVIRSTDVKPFMEIFLPDPDVLSVEQVILKDGTDYTENPTLDEFFDDNNRFYEVDYLAQSRIFTANESITGGTGIKSGRFIDITKKLIKEFTDSGFCKLTFGGGNGDLDLFKTAISGGTTYSPLASYLENTTLGEIPKANSTMYIRYRVGGGSNSNVGAGILTTVGNLNIDVNGSREDLNRQVKRSVKVSNQIPALGGVDSLSTEQIRYLISYNFSSQNRCVTLNDYLIQVYKMPGKFGSPFRLTVFKEHNKIVIPIIGLDENSKLNNTSTSLLKQNIAEYLAEYRMVNDFVEVKDGRIYNLGFEFTLYIDERVPKSQIANNTILSIANYFDINKRQIDDDIYLGSLIENINNVNGVLNIIDYKVFNKVGGNYSINEIEMEYKDDDTREIQLIDNTIFSSLDSMFEIKYPEKDIKLILKRRTDLGKRDVGA